MKSPFDPKDKIDQALSELAAVVSSNERNFCAELVQQMADAEEDPTRKDLLNDVVVAIRRMPFKRYQ